MGNNFSQLQARVTTRVIDLPPAVQSEVPTLINDAIHFLSSSHNFNCMRAEAQVNTTAGSHALANIPSGWKEPRGSPYYVLQVGDTRELDWLPNRQMMYRQWPANDRNSSGPPRNLLISEPAGSDPEDLALGLEVYPFPDGLSDWTTSPAGEYRVHIPYWGTLPDLVNPTDDNWFTDHADRFLVDFATSEAFSLDWDEERAQYWMMKAVGKSFDGSNFNLLGGWARVAMNLDKSMSFAPGRVLVPRRDQYAPVQQWRT